MKDVDLSLCLVTDGRKFGTHSFMDAVKMAVDGGVTIVQLREKTASRDEIREKAFALLKILEPLNIPLIINDHVELVGKVGAQGVHLGKSDCDVKRARQILGPDAVIGRSIETLRDYENSECELCDYVSASPVFATPTKPDVAKPIGLDGVAKLRVACPIPLIGIGGITAKNTPSLALAGLDGVAVVSTIMWDADPRQAARSIRNAFELHRRRRAHGK